MSTFAAGPFDLSTIEVELPDGEVVVAEVRRSPRVRVTRIQVAADRPLRVVVPDGASDEFAADAVRNKANWVKTKLRLVEQTREAVGALGLSQPGVVWRAGRTMPVTLTDAAKAHVDNGVLHVPAKDADVALRRWYRNEAKEYLRDLVTHEAHRLGLKPSAVVIRDQKTRWGSCSSAGTISLNWRLLLAPEEVARYVVVHELVHLRHPNHSKSFWRTLASSFRDWRTQSEWLRRHGYELRVFEPRARIV
jgi:predicted metal-dependent hydrolase